MNYIMLTHISLLLDNNHYLQTTCMQRAWGKASLTKKKKKKKKRRKEKTEKDERDEKETIS